MMHQELGLLSYLPRDRSAASLFLKYQQGRRRCCVAGSRAGRAETTIQPFFPREASGTRRRDWEHWHPSPSGSARAASLTFFGKQPIHRFCLLLLLFLHPSWTSTCPPGRDGYTASRYAITPHKVNSIWTSLLLLQRKEGTAHALECRGSITLL